MDKAARPGFTLIELLAALALLGVIAGGMTLALGASLRAATTLQERAERSDERRALVARLKADLQGVWVRPGSETTWFRGLDAGFAGSGGSAGDVLTLTTSREVSPEILATEASGSTPEQPQSDVAEVSWQLETDADGVTALVRRERTPPDAEVEIAQDAAVAAVPYARGIGDFRLRYFDGVDWLDTWDTTTAAETGETATDAATTGLPLAVEVTLYREEAGSSPGAEHPAPGTAFLTLVLALPGASEPAAEAAP